MSAMPRESHPSDVSFSRQSEARQSILPLTRISSHPDDRSGFPTRAQFAEIIDDYLSSLNRRRASKALISSELYNTILYTLRNPRDVTVEDPQFRFWARKMFTLDDTGRELRHQQRPVAIKEDLYNILVQCHERCRHGGRDRTCSEIQHSHVPRNIVAAFVRQCPTCAYRRNVQDANSANADLRRTGPADRVGDTDVMEIDKAGPVQSSINITDDAVTVGDCTAIMDPGSTLDGSGYGFVPRSTPLRRANTDPQPRNRIAAPAMHLQTALQLARTRSASHRVGSAERLGNQAVVPLTPPVNQVRASSSSASSPSSSTSTNPVRRHMLQEVRAMTTAANLGVSRVLQEAGQIHTKFTLEYQSAPGIQRIFQDS